MNGLAEFFGLTKNPSSSALDSQWALDSALFDSDLTNEQQSLISGNYRTNLGGMASPTSSTSIGDILGNKDLMSGITGLASTVFQAAALPSMLKTAKLQNEAMSKNIAAFEEDRANLRKSRDSFNQVRSAFV